MWPALITGGLGLLGSIFSSNSSASNNAANIQMQQQTNALNVQEAQKNRDFQEQMSNTAYQRSSADMQKAGLNPAAMFGSGQAASSPGGSQASLQAPQARETPGRAFEHLGRVASDAINSAVTAKTVDKMEEEIAKIKTDREYVKALERTEQERPLQVATSTADIANKLPVGRLSGKEAEQILQMQKDHPEFFKYLKQGGYIASDIGTMGRGAGDVAAAFFSGAKSAVRFIHEWKGPPGITPSQRKEIMENYDRVRGLN